MSGKGKLVRDKIPEIIKKDGKTPIFRSASSNKTEHEMRLGEKLVEEAREFADSGRLEELADIQELILAICDFRRISSKKLHEIRRKKREECGGFEKGIILEGISGSA